MEEPAKECNLPDVQEVIPFPFEYTPSITEAMRRIKIN